MTTDVWLTQVWTDYRMAWDKKEFNNISVFHMPAKDIWVLNKLFNISCVSRKTNNEHF